MERDELKKLFEAMEERSIYILELTDFLKVVSEDNMIDETGRFIYIIAKILHEECDCLEIERNELRMACLD